MTTLLLAAALLAGTQDTVTYTLEQAVQRAALISPGVLAAEGAIAAPTGERSVVRLPFQGNPVVQYAGADRTTGSHSVWDWEWSLRQEIEIGGQWSARSSAEEHRIRAAQELVSEAARATGLDTRIRFLDLRMATRIAELADSTAEFAERLSAMASERLDAGAISVLEYNTAVIEAARTRSQAERAAALREATEARLAVVLGVPAPGTVQALPLPPLPDFQEYDRAALVAVAEARRPDLRADSLSWEASDRDVTAASRRVIPNLELAGFTGREEGTDDLLGFSIGAIIPLVDHGQGDKGRAEASRAAAEARMTETRRAIQAQVVAAASRFERNVRAERRFAVEGLAAARENASLVEMAFEEGAVGIAQVVVLREAAVAAEVEYIEARRSAYESWFQLSAALRITPQQLIEFAPRKER
ncbi:MAG: TolC family protein [marine benthic group bacterium]|jgi:outer membrane protein TolC|nr:TolC family protein [Gemmatimonadota bacterium]